VQSSQRRPRRIAAANEVKGEPRTLGKARQAGRGTSRGRQVVGASCQVSGRLPCRIASRHALVVAAAAACVTARGRGEAWFFLRLPSRLMGAAAANAGASPESCGGQRHGTEAMGGYELVRSDDAPAAAIAVDLEAGGTTAPCGDDYPKRRRGSSTPSPPAPASTRPQRLVSLDVFRGITVLVRTTNHSHLSSSLPCLLPPSFLLFFFE